MIRPITHSEKEKWDAYVLSSPQFQFSHRYSWRFIFERVFQLKTFYFVSESNGKINGVCPLAWQKSALFGSNLISLPYLNTAGILSDSDQIRRELYETALALAKKTSADYLELRHLNYDLKEIPFFDHKVTFILDLPSQYEVLLKQFKDKVRNQIHKGEKEKLEVHCVDVAQGIDSFYPLFSLNMRNLGTPVLPKSFFLEVAREFSEETKLFVCTWNQKPLAAGFTFRYQNKMEIPWAASDWKFLEKAPNMFLYAEILKWACEHGVKQFDFGRCTKEGGTYHFKKQWGGVEIPLYWYHQPRRSSGFSKPVQESSLMQLGNLLWRHLPLSLTQKIGPKLARSLPF